MTRGRSGCDHHLDDKATWCSLDRLQFASEWDGRAREGYSTGRIPAAVDHRGCVGQPTIRVYKCGLRKLGWIENYWLGLKFFSDLGKPILKPWLVIRGIVDRIQKID